MGSVHKAGGMLVHELSVMAVILNGMRLRWAKKLTGFLNPVRFGV
jgi:hypothetical protein